MKAPELIQQLKTELAEAQKRQREKQLFEFGLFEGKVITSDEYWALSSVDSANTTMYRS